MNIINIWGEKMRDAFINNYSVHIEKACERQDNIDNYEICKEVWWVLIAKSNIGALYL